MPPSHRTQQLLLSIILVYLNLIFLVLIPNKDFISVAQSSPESKPPSAEPILCMSRGQIRRCSRKVSHTEREGEIKLKD